MKKFLSLVLAVVMVASMASVAFAASDFKDAGGRPDKKSPQVIMDELLAKEGGTYDGKDGYPINTTIFGPFGYDTDDKALTLESVEYGKTAYYLLTEYYDSGVGASGVRLVTNSDSTKSLKVKGDWEEGKSLVDGMAIVKKRVDSVGMYDDEDDFIEANGVNNYPGSSSTKMPDMTSSSSEFVKTYGFKPGNKQYYYMVAITVKDSTSTNDADIIGTMTLSKSKTPKADSIEFDLAINVDWEQSYRKDENLVITDGVELKSETYYSLKFDGDEEVEFTFDDDSTFNVDISGQSKMLFYYDTDFKSSIASKYPDAELNFWNGNGAKFNRTGELFLSTGDSFDDPYLYQVNSDGTLSKVSGAEYDDADEGFYLKTRALGSYVYSDIELDLSASDSTDDSKDPIVTPIEPVTPVNPGTGAKA